MFAGIILQGLKRITLANGLSTGQKSDSSGKRFFGQSVGMGIQIGLDFSHGFQPSFLNGCKAAQTLKFFYPEVDSRPDLGPIDRTVHRVSQPEILPVRFVGPHTGKAAAAKQTMAAPGVPVVLILLCMPAAL